MSFIQGFQFGCGLIVAGLVAALILSIFNDRDSTDAPNKRSGVIVVTDYATGMQYLRTPSGGITPRINAEGKQMRAQK